jgi:hypothetical protein
MFLLASDDGEAVDCGWGYTVSGTGVSLTVISGLGFFKDRNSNAEALMIIRINAYLTVELIRWENKNVIKTFV